MEGLNIGKLFFYVGYYRPKIIAGFVYKVITHEKKPMSKFQIKPSENG